jgi:hypothetical protein
LDEDNEKGGGAIFGGWRKEHRFVTSTQSIQEKDGPPFDQPAMRDKDMTIGTSKVYRRNIQWP